MTTHMVPTPDRHAQPRPNGRSASCSAEARTVAPSHTAARMKKAMTSNSQTTATSTISATWSASQVVTWFWKVAKSVWLLVFEVLWE